MKTSANFTWCMCISAVLSVYLAVHCYWLRSWCLRALLELVVWHLSYCGAETQRSD